MSVLIKIKGKEAGIGDWLSISDHGVMKMGRVQFLSPTESNFWRNCEIKTDAGDRIHFVLNSHDYYNLHTFVAEDDQNNDDFANLMLRTGQPMGAKYARMPLEKLLERSDYKYRARDGRLIFKDGSALLLNSDSSRTVFDTKGKEMEWPRLLVRR